MKRLLAACVAAATALVAPAAGKEAWQTFSTTLQPKAVHEECVRVESGETRRYVWKSDAPIDFNIHYHKGDEVSYPVKRGAMRGDGGTFAARTGEDYCWMWTARDKPAKLEGRVELRPE